MLPFSNLFPTYMDYDSGPAPEPDPFIRINVGTVCPPFPVHVPLSESGCHSGGHTPIRTIAIAMKGGHTGRPYKFPQSRIPNLES